MKVGIIGAGIAGIASAIRMASRGYTVHVFEANEGPGGKLGELRQAGYRFDTGPSLFTMPMYVDELFELAGVEPRSHFHYERLPIVCRYFWEDGTRLSAYAQEEDFGEEIRRELGVDPSVLHEALADSRLKYELTGRTFLEHSLHKVRTWTTREVLRALGQLPSLDIFRSMNEVNERLLKHPKLIQLFNRYATYNGSNPYKAPGILNIIPYFEHEIGAYFPKGGMYAITQSLYQLAQLKGVQFHFGQRVEEIVVKNRQAKGIKVAGQVESFDRVISNMDIYFTYQHLLPNERTPKSVLTQARSTSALIFYWGIQQQFPELDLHNIFFSEDYKGEFAKLEAGQLHDDPTVYINITQKFKADDAPAGCENWFTMINAPCQSGQDWETMIQQARQRILAKLSRILGRDIAPLIVTEAILDPRTIESRTQSYRGALYGPSSNDRMAAFVRHANFSQRIKSLYFCGGSVHPGGGIPLCLLSARIVDQLMHGLSTPIASTKTALS
ncbi:MAG: 1-hydroxycarotenoid 3,4-desaturase CrtD [Bacteroidota bacterium]